MFYSLSNFCSLKFHNIWCREKIELFTSPFFLGMINQQRWDVYQYWNDGGEFIFEGAFVHLIHLKSKNIYIFNLFTKYMMIHSKIYSRVQNSIENFVLWSKMPMFQRTGMKEGGLPLPLAFQYLILMIKRACDLNLVMISSLASKCQHFKHGGLQFHFIKQLKNGHPNFKDLLFWNQWRHHDQI